MQSQTEIRTDNQTAGRTTWRPKQQDALLSNPGESMT